MPVNVIMPALGVAQQTGTLLKWLKAEGEAVTKGEPLMEIETDKATVEIEAAASGVLVHVAARPGDQIPVGQTIALIIAPGEKVAAQTHKTLAPVRSPRQEDRQEGLAETRTTPASFAPQPGLSNFARVLASPAAKRLARERGLSLASIRGSGPEGSVLVRDVMGTGRDDLGSGSAGSLVPLSAMRRIVGERMVQSKQSAPHFYLSMDIDMERVQMLREAWKSGNNAPAPSINDFVLHSCARALKAFPSVNASFTPSAIQLHPRVHIGIAVALEEGLVVPVLRDADRLSLSELALKSRELIDKAHKKKLLPDDFEGGGFTVSNLGMLGVDSFTAIINPPQCAILAVGRVAERVVAIDGMFAIRRLMTATLSADHRVLDGAIAARFLRDIKIHLESANFE